MAKFTIEVRTKGFVDASAKIDKASQSTRKFVRDSNKGSEVTAAFRREVSALRNNMLLVSFAVFGTVRALGGFIKTASDARESLNKFKVVFGDFAPEAEQFAQSITNSFGIAKQEMIELLAGLQDTFVPMGFSREQASELSQSIAQLSLDVGSFQNVATAEVANRFTSAIVGNHEAVRTLGISLTEATLKTEAMRLGLGDASGELDQTQKIMARLSLIARGSADAVGDLDRTNQEFANRLRATQGRLLELRRQLGELLIPIGEVTLSFVDFMANTRRMGIVLTGLGIAFGPYAAGAIKAAFAQATLNKTMQRNIFIFGATTLALAIDSIGESLRLWGQETSQADDETKDLNETIKQLSDLNIDLTGGLNDATDAAKAMKEAQEDLKQSISDSEDALLIRLVTMQQNTEADKASTRALINENRSLTMLEVERLNAIDTLIAENKAKAEAIRLSNEQAKVNDQNRIASLKNQDAANRILEESALIQAKLDGMADLDIEKMKLRTELAQGLSQAVGGSAGSYSDYIEALNNGVSAEELLNGITEGSIENQKMLGAAFVDLFNKKTAIAEADAIQVEKDKKAALQLKEHKANMDMFPQSILTAAGAIKTLGDSGDNPEQQLSALLQTLGGVLMMVPGMQVPGALLQAGSMFVGHTGGLIKNNGIQRFANGGIVQGQDNVPIMAQAGEFIMRRSAVESIGVQNLAEMNAGSSTPGITVNIQGNMVGNEDFVRDTLIPHLKQATNQELA